MKHKFEEKYVTDKSQTFGHVPCSVVVYDTIHIFGWIDQVYVDFHSFHYVYNPKENTIKQMRDKITTDPKEQLQKNTVIYYKNRLYRFGGFDGQHRKDLFAVSNIIKRMI